MATASQITQGYWHKLPIVHLQCGGAEATVTPFGAQLLSWIPADGRERLYLSPTTACDGQQPIRGGIPVIFPQWADRGPKTRHGFARRVVWKQVDARTAPDFVFAVWRLEAGALPAPFRDELPGAWWTEVTVLLEPWRLDVELAVGNGGSEPLTFTGGLHTYLATSNVEASTLAGLTGVTFRDANAGWTPVTDEAALLQVTDAVNRVYPAPTRALLWQTPEHAITIEQATFADLVVWNPWEAHGLADLPTDGFRRFLCVEAAQLTTPVTLAAGEEWVGRQSLTAYSAPGAEPPIVGMNR